MVAINQSNQSKRFNVRFLIRRRYQGRLYSTRLHNKQVHPNLQRAIKYCRERKKKKNEKNGPKTLPDQNSRKAANNKKCNL